MTLAQIAENTSDSGKGCKDVDFSRILAQHLLLNFSKYPPAPRGQQHTVELGTLTYQRLKLMFATVRLFADSAAPASGMPRYQVIYGVEGKRKIIPRRALSNPRRIFL